MKISRSQSYQNLISSFFQFLLLSFRVCSIRKYFLHFEMAKLKSKKLNKSSFYEAKSLVGLTPGLFFLCHGGKRVSCVHWVVNLLQWWFRLGLSLTFRQGSVSIVASLSHTHTHTQTHTHTRYKHSSFVK